MFASSCSMYGAGAGDEALTEEAPLRPLTAYAVSKVRSEEALAELEIPLEERKKVNFDHPDALDWELLHEHLVAIAAGRAFDEPVYSFADYARTAETRRIEPGDFLIVEGLFTLYWPELRAMLDTKVYVQTDPSVCFARRLARDVAERGRTPESVREQYERTVRPSAEWFVHPTEKFADLVVSGEQPLERSAGLVTAALHLARAAGAR